MSQLEKLGLTQEEIFNGEIAECNPVKPKLGDKRKFYLAEEVDAVIQAYAADLLELYGEIETLKTDYEQLNDEVVNLRSREEQMIANDVKIRQFEELMNSLEASMSEVQAAKQDDLMKINELSTSLKAAEDNVNKAKSDLDKAQADLDNATQHVQELESENQRMQTTVQELEEDVNEVLDGLRDMMVDEGLADENVDSDVEDYDDFGF